MADDDEEEAFGGAFENGHWVWDDSICGLKFLSDKPVARVEDSIKMKAPVKVEAGTMTFNEDVDLLEQLRFRKRYARRLTPGQEDIITVQDVMDLAIFTAPVSLLSPSLINLLHVPTAERFIRGLILYCQYYLQVEEKLAFRMAELEKKVRTPQSELMEAEFRENLSDLRTLVAKEYSILLIGGADTKKFHHMGPVKKRKSLTNKDARLFETFLRMTIQIVWLALSRRSYNKLELEINRMFKTDYFNVVEHTLKTGFITNMKKEEATTVLGHCLRHDKKLVTRSPLMNEAFCYRPVDYRMLELGVIQYDDLDTRLRYMLVAVASPENSLQDEDVVVGILGLPRRFFDTMLRVLPTAFESTEKSNLKTTKSLGSTGSSANSKTSVGKKGDKEAKYVYKDVVLPPKSRESQLPDAFPSVAVPPTPANEEQRKRWMTRLYKLLNPSTCKH